MLPKDCARLIVDLADEEPIYDSPAAVDEVIYLLAWFMWDMVDAGDPDWTEALARQLDRIRPAFTSAGAHKRFAAYSEAKANQAGGGPGWHIARTFQQYVLGGKSAKFDDTLEVSVRLAALMKGLQSAIVADD